MVDATQTLALIKLAKQGDNEAKNELINQNYPLVKSVIRRYKSFNFLFRIIFIYVVWGLYYYFENLNFTELT